MEPSQEFGLRESNVSTFGSDTEENTRWAEEVLLSLTAMSLHSKTFYC